MILMTIFVKKIRKQHLKFVFCEYFFYYKGMLIEFSVNNYKSIKDDLTLNMMDLNNSSKALPSVVLYGANASGKSSVMQALMTMQRIVLNKDRIMLSTDKLPYNPFRLSSQTENAPTSFDVVFEMKSKKYKYGFSYDSKKIVSEYLLVYETARPTTIYEFENGVFKPNSKIPSLKKIVKPDNFLYLWEADKQNVESAKIVLEWFDEFTHISFDDDGGLRGIFSPRCLDFLDKQSQKNMMVSFLQTADTGIKDVLKDVSGMRKQKRKLQDGSFEDYFIESRSVKTIHEKYGANKKREGLVSFDLFDDESTGTKKMFFIAEVLMIALLEGGVLFLDEMDANLHPILTQKLIKFFCDPEINTIGAQLVFSSQDTNLLDLSLLKKEQIYFVEKDGFGASHLTSLSDFNNVRNSEKVERNYILGKYGAIPYIGVFDFFKKG